MTLSEKEIRSVLRGAVDIVQTDSGAFQPLRFSENQIRVAGENPAFLIRALSSSGMCMSFETDAAALTLAYSTEPGSAHDEYAFDTWVDGRLFHHYANAISARPDGTLRVELPGGLHRIKLYLPHLAKTTVRAFTAENASVFKPVREEKRLLCLGDSITQGYIAHFPSNTYPAILARRMGAALLNQGIGGECFHAEMLDECLQWHPTHVIISYGTNDWVTKREYDFIRDAHAYIRKARQIWKDIPVAAITPIWRADHAVRERPDMDLSFMRAREIVQSIALEHDLIHIPGEDIFPPVDALMDDGYVHPNDLGFTFYASGLAEALPADWFK